MIRFLAICLLLSGLGLNLSCQNNNSASTEANLNKSSITGLRALNIEERKQDFDQILELLKAYYGPYAYKESFLNLNIETLAMSLKEKAVNAKTDEEFAGYVMQIGAALKDGHVQIHIENTASGIRRYRVPILLTPVEGKALIGDIGESLRDTTQFAIGDEVVEVDGKSPFDYLPTITKYQSFAREESNLHRLVHLFSRASFMTDLVPTSKSVRVKIKKPNGTMLAMDIPWEQNRYNEDLGKLIPNKFSRLDLGVGPFVNDMNSVVGNIAQMGDVKPFFLTAETQDTYKFTKVYPSDEARKKFGLEEKETPPIYAALYKFSGKTILLVRQATYSPDDYKSKVYMKAYMALFSEFQDLADILVLDQTHNPGGSYCADFYDLFARPSDFQAAENVRADRKWINDLFINWPEPLEKDTVSWDNRIVESWGLMVEQAYDKGSLLSDPIPLFTGSFFPQKRKFNWSKPMFVLIDELAGSCGDVFPMLVKANGRAKLFGQNTMGLGGNVEEVGILTNSRIHVSMTRGLFYPYNPSRPPLASEFVENNGVGPDYPYTHTVEDFRGGFVEYVKAFSEKAILQLNEK